jgi:glycosyltransferase involved in cell wall biosynthesis
MNLTNKTLCLYTAQFPYGLGEQFIETEIKYLAQSFGHIFIFPSNTDGLKRNTPANVEIIKLNFEKYNSFSGLKNIGKWFFECLPDVFLENEKELTISKLIRAGFQANELYKYLKAHALLEEVLHYSYWFDNWSLILSILKSQGLITHYISRAHGFDLYEYRRKNNHIPFRQFQLKHISKLYLISKDGLDYIQHKFPFYSPKYELSYLGVENKDAFIPLVNLKQQYLIVSCSRLIDIKRVDLIIKTLALIKDLQIKWVHFGGGELLKKIDGVATHILPENIEWELKGQVDNINIYNFYKTSTVDLFINLSLTEGLPVTIMEAISFGIPILATDVGGTKEIVNKTTGMIISSEIGPNAIADNIKDVIKNYSRDISAKQKIYNFWDKNFNATINYQNFISKILNEIHN